MQPKPHLTMCRTLIAVEKLLFTTMKAIEEHSREWTSASLVSAPIAINDRAIFAADTSPTWSSSFLDSTKTTHKKYIIKIFPRSLYFFQWLCNNKSPSKHRLFIHFLCTSLSRGMFMKLLGRNEMVFLLPKCHRKSRHKRFYGQTLS